MKIRAIFKTFSFAAAGTLFAVIFSACTSTRLSNDVGQPDIRLQIRYEAKTSIAQERVEGVGESTTYLHIVSENTDYGTYGDSGTLFSGLTNVQALALRSAISDACKKAGADILLGTQYEMTTTSFWIFYEHATCKASGFPAKIESIKQIPIAAPNAPEAE